MNDGQTLTIEAGTVIRAKTGQGSLASALIVARGGRIIAQGERDRPIVFTVEGDDLQGSIPVMSRGLWGGVIILGNAVINTETGEDMIEGIPISEPRGIYGGMDDNDNSGIISYVSIRHGGTNIGEGNEINGLTLGGVGRQTTIDHVEVISNADDGIEFFGGDVNCKNLCVAFCGDDAFDMDQGYHGKGQFWLSINSPDSDQAAEISGGIKPFPALPGYTPLVYNATMIGDSAQTGSSLIHFLDYGRAYLGNSIFLEPGKGAGIKFSEKAGDSYDAFLAGRIQLDHNIFYPQDSSPGLFTYSELGKNLLAQNSLISDSMQAWSTSYDDPGIWFGENPSLLPPETVSEKQAPYAGEWFDEVTYKGAFGSRDWIGNWTLLDQYLEGRE